MMMMMMITTTDNFIEAVMFVNYTAVLLSDI